MARQFRIWWTRFLKTISHGVNICTLNNIWSKLTPALLPKFLISMSHNHVPISIICLQLSTGWKETTVAASVHWTLSPYLGRSIQRSVYARVLMLYFSPCTFISIIHDILLDMLLYMLLFLVWSKRESSLVFKYVADDYSYIHIQKNNLFFLGKQDGKGDAWNSVQ